METVVPKGSNGLQYVTIALNLLLIMLIVTGLVYIAGRLPQSGGAYTTTTTVTKTTTLTSTVTETRTATTVEESIVVLTEGQRDGPLLVEKIFLDYITGLQFREYPVPVGGIPVILRIGESASNGCDVTLTLVKIEGKTATFTKRVEYGRACPICLSGGIYIDTPNGPISVKDLEPGMPVWTADAEGFRKAAVVMEAARTPVHPGFRMVHIVLADGRELLASPGHPLPDGRRLQDLMPGDILDGGTVKIVHESPYGGGFTYDILPSGETGLYWANGILLKSSLAK